MTISEPDRDANHRVQNLTGPVEGKLKAGFFTSTSDPPAHWKRGDPSEETGGFLAKVAT